MALKAGSTYGSIMNPGHSMWSPMGSQAQYYDVGGVTEPEDNQAFVNLATGYKIKDDNDRANQKFDLFKGLLGNMKGMMDGGGSGYGNYNQGMNIPAPRYASYSPVYSQSQVDAQAGLQRSNLMNQAQQSNRRFTQSLGQRGFSPNSPFGLLNSESSLMRANSGAAQNETNLNFQAAGANSDARIKTAQINSQLQGDYMRAMAQQQQGNSQYNLQRQSQQNDLFKMLLGGLM